MTPEQRDNRAVGYMVLIAWAAIITGCGLLWGEVGVGISLIMFAAFMLFLGAVRPKP